MATNDISEGAGDDSETEVLGELKWTLAKSLLDANAHCTQAFENYLLLTHRTDASSGMGAVEESIQRAIDEHERIVEQLELAAEVASELKDDERV